MSVKITTLIENSPGEHKALKVEHGISFHIEKDGHSLLFDTGQSGTFLENAKQLCIDLSAVESVVLSHGHYDHSGGLRSLTEITTDFELILGDGFFNKKYGFRNGRYEYLGNNFDEPFLKERGVRYRFAKQVLTELCPGVHVVTHFSRTHKDEVVNPRFKLSIDGALQDDPFDDEVLVAVDSPKGLIVLLGCSHPGMKNMLETVSLHLHRPLYAVLGGTHLVESSPESLMLSLQYLGKDSLEIVGVSHCTGDTAMEQLAATNRHYYHNRTGSALIVA